MGDRTGDFDLVGLRIGELVLPFAGEMFLEERPADFLQRVGELALLGDNPAAFFGENFLGEKLLVPLPRIGDKLPLVLTPIFDPLSSFATLFANEFSNEVRMGLQLSPSMLSPETSIPLDDEEEMCETLSDVSRRLLSAPLLERREEAARRDKRLLRPTT